MGVIYLSYVSRKKYNLLSELIEKPRGNPTHTLSLSALFCTYINTAEARAVSLYDTFIKHYGVGIHSDEGKILYPAIGSVSRDWHCVTLIMSEVTNETPACSSFGKFNI